MTNKRPKKPLAQQHKREWHGAHLDWSFSPNAFRWTGEMISGPNMLPLATEMRAWLLQLGHLSLMPPLESPTNGGFYNSYTTSSNTLGLVLSRVVIASYNFTTSATENDDEVDTEIERIRLYNELIINCTRFCEATIKQLLYCTNIPKSKYESMALGQLLESQCKSCKKENGKTPHKISFTGTLAHPFELCKTFEHCAMDHMNLVNKMRNTQAAHADIQALQIRSIAESKTQFQKDCQETLDDFVHMLSHLEDLELRIQNDLAEKAISINHLKKSGLAAEDCNFNLAPGKPFLFNSYKASDNNQ